MDRFIARANIRHFGDRLRKESDGELRCRLQKLLIEEEDKLGRDLELLADVERTIASFDALIHAQAAVVAALNGHEGDGLAKARTFLDGLVETHTLYKEYHRRLAGSVRINHS
jgi:hypothetical protein